MQLRDYQSKMLSDILEDVDSGVKRIVMAMCPNAGKTYTSIRLIEELLSSKRSKKVLVLAHGTSILRTQYYSSLVEYSPSFSFKQLDPDNKDTDAQVLVGLPQGLERVDLSGIDTVIFDEAHERYLATQTQRFMKTITPKFTILLTGTPSKFVYENHVTPDSYSIHFVAMSDIPAEYMANTEVYVCSSNYNIKEEHFNENEEVVTSYKFNKKDTEKTIDSFLTRLHKLLKTRNVSNIDNLIQLSFSTLKKTMIACKTQQQARFVHLYLVKNKVNAVISTSDTDDDSKKIEDFTKNEQINVLIVVNRGILGFNLPELVNVVDMTGSRNLNVMYQLFSRVTRVHEGSVKRYFKIAPKEEVEYTNYVTSAMLSLIHRDNIKVFNGRNFKSEIPILVKKVERGQTKRNASKGKAKAVPKLYEFEGVNVIDVFTRLYSNLDKELQVYSKTTLGEVKFLLGISSQQIRNYWTIENCKLDAKNYSSRSEWCEKSGAAYASATRNGWLEDCCVHMKNREKVHKGYWTLEKCKLVALKYTKRVEFYEQEPSAYFSCRKNNWLEEVCSHMYSPRSFPKKKKITCIETGKVFKSITEASKVLRLNRCLISRTLNSHINNTQGYTFKYVEENNE